jgi:hypothetical protein
MMMRAQQQNSMARAPNANVRMKKSWEILQHGQSHDVEGRAVNSCHCDTLFTCIV